MNERSIQSSLLYSRKQIDSALHQLAGALNRYCEGGEWLVICILNGGLVFTGQLLPRLLFAVQQDFIRISRYQGGTSGGQLNWYARPETPLKGKRILLLDDIFDEGKTLKAVMEYCQQEGAEEVISSVLIEKRHDRKVKHFKPDFVGLTCPDAYVYGFGMDYNELYRNLPEIRMLTN